MRWLQLTLLVCALVLVTGCGVLSGNKGTVATPQIPRAVRASGHTATAVAVPGRGTRRAATIAIGKVRQVQSSRPTAPAVPQVRAHSPTVPPALTATQLPVSTPTPKVETRARPEQLIPLYVRPSHLRRSVCEQSQPYNL